MEKKDIEKIVYYGSLAPSGENCQPWRFHVSGDKIYIYNIPGRDNSLYSWGQRASLVAHGALIENLIISSKHLGFNPELKLFPNPNEVDCVAEVAFTPSGRQMNEFYEFIEKRITNRKPYHKDKILDQGLLDEFYQQVSRFGDTQLIFVSEKDKIKTLGEAASVNEKLLFENKAMHSFFFSHVNWTKKQEEARRVGLYIKTFEIPLLAQLFFLISSNWNWLKFLNRLGFSNMVAKENAKTYSSASAMGAIVISDKRQDNYVLVGRAVERIWLAAANHGLSIQPLTGIIFLELQIDEGDTDELTDVQKKLIRDTYSRIKEAFNHPSGTIAFMFRIGYATEPIAKSIRLPPEVTYE